MGIFLCDMLVMVGKHCRMSSCIVLRHRVCHIIIAIGIIRCSLYIVTFIGSTSAETSTYPPQPPSFSLTLSPILHSQSSGIVQWAVTAIWIFAIKLQRLRSVTRYVPLPSSAAILGPRESISSVLRCLYCKQRTEIPPSQQDRKLFLS